MGLSDWASRIETDPVRWEEGPCGPPPPESRGEKGELVIVVLVLLLLLFEIVVEIPVVVEIV
jgi:hypothetical protein